MTDDRWDVTDALLVHTLQCLPFQVHRRVRTPRILQEDHSAFPRVDRPIPCRGSSCQVQRGHNRSGDDESMDVCCIGRTAVSKDMHSSHMSWLVVLSKHFLESCSFPQPKLTFDVRFDRITEEGLFLRRCYLNGNIVSATPVCSLRETPQKVIE